MSEPQNFRDRLLGDLDQRYDKLVGVIDAALEAKQEVWLGGPACKKKSKVLVQDTRAAIAAAEFFANQSSGRPGVDDRGADSEQERITFTRVLHLTDQELEKRVIDAAESFVPAEHLEAFLAACALGGVS